MRKFALNFGLVTSLALNYTSVHLLNIIWDLDILYYLVLVFVVSLLFGVIVVDVRKSIALTCVALATSVAITFGLYMMPYWIFAESMARINVTVVIFFNVIAKLLVVGAILFIVGTLIGCFIGEELASRQTKT